MLMALDSVCCPERAFQSIRNSACGPVSDGLSEAVAAALATASFFFVGEHSRSTLLRKAGESATDFIFQWRPRGTAAPAHVAHVQHMSSIGERLTPGPILHSNCRIHLNFHRLCVVSQTEARKPNTLENNI